MIRVENVSKTYTGKQGTVEAVKDVSLEISRGEIFGVIGFSGEKYINPFVKWT